MTGIDVECPRWPGIDECLCQANLRLARQGWEYFQACRDCHRWGRKLKIPKSRSERNTVKKPVAEAPACCRECRRPINAGNRDGLCRNCRKANKDEAEA